LQRGQIPQMSPGSRHGHVSMPPPFRLSPEAVLGSYSMPIHRAHFYVQRARLMIVDVVVETWVCPNCEAIDVHEDEPSMFRCYGCGHVWTNEM